MNPFRIGDTLHVQFGTRQAFVVAALRTDACLMRFPHSTPMSKWYSVGELLLWNPQPCRAIVPVSIPVQFPAIVPGLRILRSWHDPIATFPSHEDYTVVYVMGGYAFIRHNGGHYPGSIVSRHLRTFWHDRHTSALRICHEAVSLSGAELKNIAEQWRDLVRTGNPLTTIWRRFNNGLDQLTPDQWDTLQAGWDYYRTQRMLDAQLRKVAS